MRLRLGGLGQPWQTFKKLVSILFVSQMVSPLVALVSIFVSGAMSITTLTAESTTQTSEQLQTRSTVSTTSTPVILSTLENDCCHNETKLYPCPNDHKPDHKHPQCKVPGIPCSSLPLSCISCNCSYSCKYGALSNATCTVPSEVQCSGPRSFQREFRCSYCYLTSDDSHRCSSKVLGCRSVGSPTSKAHWYIANCTTAENTLCLGKKVFSKKKECNWTEGYSWKTACILSITLGGFGADRFYLGHWQEGIGKLFSFGGLGVWTLVDVVLVSTGYIGPADGSLYI